MRNRYLVAALREHLETAILHGAEPTVNDEYRIEWDSPNTTLDCWNVTDRVTPEQRDIDIACAKAEAYRATL